MSVGRWRVEYEGLCMNGGGWWVEGGSLRVEGGI